MSDSPQACDEPAIENAWRRHFPNAAQRAVTLLAVSLLWEAIATVSLAAPPLDFNRDVRPILSDKCFHCHGPDAKAREAELRLDQRDGLFRQHDDVTVQIKLTPPQILLGQSSRLTWSIDVPQPCPVHFQLNGMSVAKTGTRMVTAPRPTKFTVAAIVSLPGQHGQRSASASLGVLYPARVVIDPTTPDPVDTVIGALTESTNCTLATDIFGGGPLDVAVSGALFLPMSDQLSWPAASTAR